MSNYVLAPIARLSDALCTARAYFSGDTLPEGKDFFALAKTLWSDK